MSDTAILTAEKREKGSRALLTALRNSDRVPGVIYGQHIDSQAISVSRRELDRVLAAAGSALVTLDLGSEKLPAIIKDLQRNILTEQIIHVDFQNVRMDEKISTSVSVKPVGEAPGVKTDGGILELLLRQLDVECLPGNLVEFIEVDISSLRINESLHVGDISPPEGIEILNDAEETVLAILPPEAEITPEETEEESAEPEVISKGKTEKEDE